MKAFQRWRNSHSASTESQVGSQRNGASSKSTKQSDPRRGVGSSSSAGSTGYSDPQDVLYPTTESKSQPVRSGTLSNQPSSSSTSDGSIWRKGLKREKSDIMLNKSMSVDALARKVAPNSPTISKAGSRIRFDSLIGRKNLSSDSHSSVKTEQKEEKPNSGRWNGSVRSFSSPKGKEEVALPDDIVSMPKISSKLRKSVKEETPLLVVSSDVKSRSSPMSNTSPTSPNKGKGPRLNGDSSTDDSMYHSPKSSAPFMISGKKESLNTLGHTRRLPTSEPTLKSSLDGDQNNHLRVVPNTASPLRSSRSSAGLLQTSKDSSYHTPSERSSLSIGETQMETLSQPGRDHYTSTIRSQSSNMSLRTSRSRISGMFGMRNKSSPGLALGGDLTSEYGKRHDLQNARSFSAHTIPTTIKSASQDLANDLNDLAVAFEEGLLGEDEYRLLRKGVFDSMMKQGAMEIPKEQTIRSAQNFPSHENNPSISDDQSKSIILSLGSKKSGKSKGTSIFRPRSQNTQLPISAPGVFPSNRSMVSSLASYSGQNGDQSKAALQDQFSQARRARTLRSVSGISKLVDPPLKQARSFSANDTTRFDLEEYDDSPQFVKSRNNQSGPTILSPNGLTISSGNALLGQDYTEKSSAEIEAEVAVVEAEGKRLLDSFKTLELHAIGRYDLTFEQIRQAIRKVEEISPGSVPSELRDGFVYVSSMDSEISSPGSLGSTNGKGLGRRSSLFSSKRQSSQSSISIANSVPTQTNQSNRTRLAQPPPSSFKAKGEVHGSPQSISRNNLPQSLSLPSNRAEDIGVRKLTEELMEIHRRKRDVAKKYDSRLAFLRSAMRSAKIREGLR